MRTINIHQAKTHLSRLSQAALGEEIVIAKAGKPVARLMPFAAGRAARAEIGTLAGKLGLADDWDGPETNEAIWAEFWENLEKES